MTVSGQELHLVVDELRSLTRSSPAGTPPRVLQTVRVPEAASYLRPGAPARGLVATSAAEEGSLVIEPLVDGSAPRLLLLAPRGATAPTINGRSAPRVCLLRVGDQILLEDGRLLHLTAFQRPQIGPATEQQVGERCHVCRTPIKQGDRVFTCPCGRGVMHYDAPSGHGQDENERLECATLPSECPICRRSISLSEGFDHAPTID
jgi:hypothetical protein